MVAVLCALGLGTPSLVHAEDARVDVQDARSLWGLGESYIHAGRYEDAYKIFSEIADRSTDPRMRVGARYNAGSAAYGAGKLEEAVSAWERVLEQNPKHAEAAHNAEEVRKEIAQRLQPPSRTRRAPVR